MKSEISIKNTEIEEKDNQILKQLNKLNSNKQEYEYSLALKEQEYELKLLDLKSEIKRVKQNLIEQHDNEINDYEERIKEIRNKMNKIIEDKNLNESKLIDHISELKQTNTEILLANETKYKEEISEYKIQLLQKDNKYDELSKTLAIEKTIGISNLQKVESNFKKLLENANNEIEELKEKIGQTETQYSNSIKLHSKAIKELNNQIDDANERSNELQEKISKLNKEKHDIQLEKQELMNSINVSL